MSSPETPYRIVAGLRVPLPLVVRIIPAMRARYPEATQGIADPDAAVRAALKAWVRETLAEYEAAKAKAPLNTAVAQTITTFEQKADAAKAKALADSEAITEDPASTPPE